MAIPAILGGIAAIAGAAGVVAGVAGLADNSEANKIQAEAEKRLTKAQKNIEVAKEETNRSIQELGKLKLQVYSGQINEFVDLFSQIKNIQLTESVGLDELGKLSSAEGTLKEMRKASLAAESILTGGIASVGAGALLGWGTYGGVMALGTASTGTAIASLSGIAAKNATLAWLGGGAIAAGGGGIALGRVVLGGIMAGPALLVAGGLFSAQAEEKLNNARSNLAEVKKIEAELEASEIELEVIENTATQTYLLLKRLSNVLDKANYGMRQIVNYDTDWNRYSPAEKNIVIAAMKTAQAVKLLLDTPLLTDEGLLTKDIKKVLEDKDLAKMAN